MKRTLGKIGFFCFCLACLEPVSMGQVSWGVKTGLNATTTTYGSEQNSGYQLGFNAGAYTKLPLGSRFFLLGELSYSPKGNPIFGGSHLSLQYLSLPLLAGYKLVGNLALVAGPTCSYLIQAKFKPDINHFDPTHYYRPLDYGFDVGLRYQFTHHMGADFRWDRGLQGIYKNDQPVYLSNGNGIWTYLGLTKVPNKDNPRNQNIQLGIFYSVK